MASITNDERLNLQKMVGEMESIDNTESIRKLKHSVLLRDDIRKLDTIRKTDTELFETDFNGFLNKCQSECSFLYKNYTDIFNRIIKDELDLDIMTKFLIVLKMVEDGKVNQHEGSVMIGKVLKELYLDSAIQGSNNLNKLNNVNEPTDVVESKNLSWKEYKHNVMKNV